MKPKIAIEARNLTQVFSSRDGAVTAVDSIDFSVSEGEIIAMLGPNGAGKTTLIDMILGFTTPAHGSLKVAGRLPSQAARAGLLGAVQQSGGLLNNLTIRQTVEMVAALYPKNININALLEATDLADIANRKVQACSGGQAQRLRFALATMHSPKILMLDEPTAGMDVGARRAFWERISAIADTGTTILFATHYLEEAQNFARRIVLMRNGKIIADGTTEQIRALTGHRYVSFLAPGPLQFEGHENIEINREGNQYRHRVSVTKAERFVFSLLQQHRVSDLEVIKPSLDESFMLLTDSQQPVSSGGTNV